jgi:hypothetical protein
VAFALYLDEDSVNRALIRALQARGMDVTNAVDSEQVGIGDLEQLEFATASGRVLFTYNVGHFYELHTRLLREGRLHGGLILAAQQRLSVGEQMRRVLKINGTLSSEQMRNRGEFLSSWG